MRLIAILSVLGLAACENTLYTGGVTFDSNGNVCPTIAGSNGPVTVAVSP